ncbi:hypothetical protein MNBD_GAMMA21-1348 [hydrothermal vent metagenome]|uniref:Uncharacterized protein n=1 Tax=hydrothermal vent metagenome TaxID=652676 RepID=A0A3B1AQF7_9ZZZZ
MSTFAYCPNCSNKLFSVGLPGNSNPSKETNRFTKKLMEKLLGIATPIVFKVFLGKDITALKKLEGIFDEAFDQFDDGQEIPLERVTFQNAFTFLLMLPNYLTLPELEIEKNGDIIMEWYKDKWNIFSVVIDKSGIYYYAGMFGSKDNRDKGRKPLFEGIDEVVIKYIKRTQV